MQLARRWYQRAKAVGMGWTAMLLVCYCGTVLLGGAEWSGAADSQPKTSVLVQLGAYTGTMPEDAYLLEWMTAIADASYTYEARKAIAVVLRTNLYAKKQTVSQTGVQTEADVMAQMVGNPAAEGKEQQEKEAAAGSDPAAGAWPLPQQRVSRAGASLPEMEQSLTTRQKNQQALSETAGMRLVVAKEGETPVSPELPFHALSAGRTRSLAGADWLVGVESAADAESAQFLTVTYVTAQTLQTIFPDIPTASWQRITFRPEPDSSYIKEVVLEDGTSIDGETFRKRLGLVSSAYGGSWIDGRLQILCKGIGHGYGMSCYGANAMALAGKSFEEILRFYYQNVEVLHE